MTEDSHYYEISKVQTNRRIGEQCAMSPNARILLVRITNSSRRSRVSADKHTDDALLKYSLIL